MAQAEHPNEQREHVEHTTRLGGSLQFGVQTYFAGWSGGMQADYEQNPPKKTTKRSKTASAASFLSSIHGAEVEGIFVGSGGVGVSWVEA